jgi:hypothetical protein
MIKKDYKNAKKINRNLKRTLGKGKAIPVTGRGGP